MKRDSLFEKLEILLVVETLILLLVLANQPAATAQRPSNAVPARVNMHQPMFKMC